MRLPVLAILVLVPTLLVGSFQLLRVPGDLTEDVFWARKVQWRDTFDVVIAGDSRAYQGVSPEEVGAFLPGARIGNFGFSSAAMAGAYLDRIGSLLSAHSSRAIIVLALTPYQLTPRAVSDNGFDYQISKARPTTSFSASIGWLRRFVAPLSFDEIAVMIRDRSTLVGANAYHADGWAESISPVYASFPALGWARTDFQGNSVSPVLVRRLVDHVREWTNEGVEVYVFAMPAAPAVDDLEARLGGFDREGVARAIEAAGGVWLTAPGGLQTYDGSHLTAASATVLSRWLGSALKPTQSTP